MLSIETSLTADEEFQPATWNGTLRIGVTDYLMEMLMYEALPNIIQKAPQAQLRLVPMREREPHEDLESGRLDLALGSFFKLRSNFYQHVLGSDDFALIMGKDHPLAKKNGPQQNTPLPRRC